MKRLVFGEGKISVGNGLQNNVPVLMFEPMEKSIPVGNITHRRTGEVIPSEEIEKKMLVFEFRNKESVLTVLEQLMSIYFVCLDKERNESKF